MTKTGMPKASPFVRIKKDVVHVNFLVLESYENGVWDYLIPGFNLVCNASDQETGHKRVKSLMDSFIQHFIDVDIMNLIEYLTNELDFVADNSSKSNLNKAYEKKKVVSSVKMRSIVPMIPIDWKDAEVKEVQLDYNQKRA